MRRRRKPGTPPGPPSGPDESTAAATGPESSQPALNGFMLFLPTDPTKAAAILAEHFRGEALGQLINALATIAGI